MSERETLKVTREWIDGKAYSIHVSKDGRVRINTGLDDQRPDHDGVNFFQPICVMRYLHANSDRVYSHVTYCGRCRKMIGTSEYVKEYCPRCGIGIAHYTFSMGTVKWKPLTWHSSDPPDYLPDFLGNGTAE